MSNIIVMAFSARNIVGCLLKKGLQRGVTGTPGPPLAIPLWRSCCNEMPGERENRIFPLLISSVNVTGQFYCQEAVTSNISHC